MNVNGLVRTDRFEGFHGGGGAERKQAGGHEGQFTGFARGEVPRGGSPVAS